MKIARVMLGVVAALALCAGARADNLVFGVPDWDQPQTYAGTPALFTDWCAPTSGANVMGHWEDNGGCLGLTDRQVFASAAAYAANANTYRQGLFNDGSVEIGWYMNTGGWKTVPRPDPPAGPNVGSTSIVNIGPGLVAYGADDYTDPSSLRKLPYAVTVAKDNSGTGTQAQMWVNYTAEIDAGRPALCTFQHWVDTNSRNPVVIDVGGTPVSVEQYPVWNTLVSEHTVAGVGYIDPTPGTINGDEWFIVHDNWGTTGSEVAVPLDQMWIQNDYVQSVVALPTGDGALIPEPGVGGLLVCLGLALRRCRN
jgi:hypothetical protein